MTSLEIEEFAAPGTNRAARTVELMHRRATEQLEGRSVWCIAAAPNEAAAADALERCLHAVQEAGVAPQRAFLEPAPPLIELFERLDAMLRGVTMLAPGFARSDEDAYAGSGQQAETLLPREVRAGDVVVLHDPIAAVLAPAIRERGAHAVWRASIGRWERNAVAAWRFLHRARPALDAYVTPWRSARTGAFGRAAIAVYISATRAVAAKETDAVARNELYANLVWTAALAEVVTDDRAERVGGTLHARPSVPSR